MKMIRQSRLFFISHSPPSTTFIGFIGVDEICFDIALFSALKPHKCANTHTHTHTHTHTRTHARACTQTTHAQTLENKLLTSINSTNFRYRIECFFGIATILLISPVFGIATQWQPVRSPRPPPPPLPHLSSKFDSSSQHVGKPSFWQPQRGWKTARMLAERATTPFVQHATLIHSRQDFTIAAHSFSMEREREREREG